MLATPTEGLHDSVGWYVQPKIDGERTVLWCDGEVWQAYTRSGRRIVTGFEEQLSNLQPTSGVALDCELADGQLWLLDFVFDPASTMAVRFDILSLLYEHLDHVGAAENIHLIDNHEAVGSADWVLDCRQQGLEGVVFKHGAAHYSWAHRSPQVRKLKFWRTATLFVIVDLGNPRRANLMSADGHSVGAVGIAGKPVHSGEKWQVRYLRFGERLREPALVRSSTADATRRADLDSDPVSNIPPRLIHV